MSNMVTEMIFDNQDMTGTDIIVIMKAISRSL